MICAGDVYGEQDSCYGDSGGPLAVYANGEWVLSGVVSWGYECANAQFPGIYARVSRYIDWIEGYLPIEVADSEWMSNGAASTGEPRTRTEALLRTRLSMGVVAIVTTVRPVVRITDQRRHQAMMAQWMMALPLTQEMALMRVQRPVAMNQLTQ